MDFGILRGVVPKKAIITRGDFRKFQNRDEKIGRDIDCDGCIMYLSHDVR